MAAIVFAVVGIGFLAFGFMVLAGAPAVTQEMAALLMILTGVLSFGIGAILSSLKQLREEVARQGESAKTTE